MPRRLRPIALLAALIAVFAFAAPMAQAADAIEAFLHRWEDPRQFDARDLDPAFRAEVSGGGNSMVLDRDQTIAFNARIRQILTGYTLKVFRIVDRQESNGRIIVTYATAYEMRLRGQPVLVREIATVTLVPGGRNGYRVVAVKSHQENIEG